MSLLAVLAAWAPASVWWWSKTGDLRPYVLLQAAPLVLIPIWQAIARAPRAERAAFALYLAAKITEHADHAIYKALGFASGHTVKHLLAAGAGAVIVATLASRVRASRRPSCCPPRPCPRTG